MKRLTTGGRVLLLFAMFLAGLASGVPSLAAQSSDVEPDYYLSELSELEIEITGDEFEIYEAELQTYEHGEGEIVQIESGTSSVQVAFFDDTDTNLETLDIYNESFSADVEDFEILDEGEDGDVVYSFATASYEDIQFLYYLSVTEDVVGNVDILQRVFAPDMTFFEDVAAAQESIEIDGEAFLADVDVEELEDLAGGAVQSGDDQETSDEDDVTPEAGATEDEEEDDSRGGAAGGDSYEFEIVPAELSVSGDIEIADSFYDEPAAEQVQLERPENGTFAIVQLMQTPMDPEGTLDAILGSFDSSLDSVENLGSDADATSAWSLDIGEAEGDEAVIYLYVDSERYDGFHYVELIFASEATFLDDLDAFNQDVEVDGEDMFAQADVDELENLLDGGSAPDDPEDEDSGTSSRSREDAKIGTGEEEEGTDSGENGTGRDETDEDTGELDLESQGLISESEFESLQHGVVVEWDEAIWGVDTTWDLSAVSDEDTGIDSVILFWQDGNASMLIQIMPADGSTPEDFVDTWESDDYVIDSVHEDAEILLADSGPDSGAVVYLTYDSDGGEVVLVQEVIDIDGGNTVGVVTMFASPEEVAAAYADAEDAVSVDGAGVVGTFTAREMESAVEP